MITPHGYSKDPSIVPDGIVITWPPGMWLHSWDIVQRVFEATLQDSVWPHRVKNPPKNEIQYVYIIIEGKIMYRCNYLEFVKEPTNYEVSTGTAWVGEFEANYPHILLSGPLVKPQHPISLKGFQGFRYCTQLF